MSRRRRKARRTVVVRNIVKVEKMLAEQNIRADRVTFRDWIRAVLHKRLRVIAAHPHHYVTAAGLSGILYATGHAERAAIVGAFAYAFIENIACAGDDK